MKTIKIIFSIIVILAGIFIAILCIERLEPIPKSLHEFMFTDYNKSTKVLMVVSSMAIFFGFVQFLLFTFPYTKNTKIAKFLTKTFLPNFIIMVVTLVMISQKFGEGFNIIFYFGVFAMFFMIQTILAKSHKRPIEEK